jgi:hypothetical protein
MLYKSKPYRYRGETEFFWQYERIYKDQVYRYCYPKYKIIQSIVTGRDGSKKPIIERIEIERPDWLKKLDEETFDPELF